MSEAIATEKTETSAGASASLLAFANVLEGTHQVPLALIRFGNNPRTIFEQAALEELAESLKSDGQLQPVGLYRLDEPDSDGRLFELEAGARRCRAAALAGWETIRAEIKPRVEEKRAYVLRLVENAQRVDLTPLERAQAYAELLKMYDGDKIAACVALRLRKKNAPKKSDEGIRAFEQTMQFATSLIAPVMDALGAERITASHAALICRIDGKHQLEALRMCFEPRPVYNGATHENEETLISEKELRGKLKARFDRGEDEPKQGKLELGDSVRRDAGAQDTNDLDRAQQQRLEGEADGILNGAATTENTEGTENGEKTAGELCGNCRKAAPTQTSEDGVPLCDACAKIAIAQCEFCNERPATRKTDNDEPICDKCSASAAQPNDYEQQRAARVDRLGRVFDRIRDIPEIGPGWLARIAVGLCPAMVPTAIFCRLYGHGLEIGTGNRIVWDGEIDGTVRDYIDVCAKMERDLALYHLRRCILIFLALPAAVNPSYPDDVIVHLEGSAPESKTAKPASRKGAKTQSKKPLKTSRARVSRESAGESRTSTAKKSKPKSKAKR